MLPYPTWLYLLSLFVYLPMSLGILVIPILNHSRRNLFFFFFFFLLRLIGYASQGQVFFKEISKSELGAKEINIQQCKWQFRSKMDGGKSLGYHKFCLYVEKSVVSSQTSSSHRFEWALSKYQFCRAFSETDFGSQRHKHVCVCQPPKHHSEETQPCFW